MEENNNDKQLIDLLNQLIQIQVQIAAIISTRFERQTTDNVKNKISQKQSNIYNEAQKYGVDSNLANESIIEFSNALEQIRKEYSTEKNLWLAQSEEFQKKEVNYTLEIATLKKQLQDTQKRVEPNKPKSTKTRTTATNGMEIVEGHHPLLDFVKVTNNLQNASLEDVSAQLDYFNGSPVMINGCMYHPFNEPVEAARLNARYFELTRKKSSKI